jgi:anaerobic C4-dicarboxylate transporter
VARVRLSFAGDAVRRKEYLQERKLLIGFELEAAKSFDQTMITLSAGALGFSIAFIQQIAPTPQYKIWLYAAWLGFAVTLIIVLVAFLVSQQATRRQRLYNDLSYQGLSESTTQFNWWIELTKGLNWLSVICFIFGVIFLVVFSIANLNETKTTTSDKMQRLLLPIPWLK